MFELFKRGNHTICEAGTIDDVKARYADGTTPPDAGTVLHIVDPPSAWIWDANSSATEGAEAFAVGASETGRFLLAQATLEEWSASVDASGGTNGYVLAIDDGRIVAQTPGTPGPHTHDLDDINQPANLAAFNNWIGVTLDTTSDPRTPSAHNHGLSDITQPANLGAFNSWLGVTLDTSSDTRDPNPHQHDLDDIASPDNLAALNDWAGVTLDTASDPRDPNAHQHALDDIEQPADLSEFNAWIGVTLDTASDPRDPNSHTHALSDVTGPNGITALNNWANTNMDNAGDPRPPEAHTQAISTINSFTLAQLNARISNANLDAAGTARPPTSHTHPYTDLTAAGESDGAVLRVVDEEFEVAQILSNGSPIAVGGAPSAGTATTAARSDHSHEIGRFDGNGVTATAGVCPLASADGFATLIQGTNQTITSFGSAGEYGCLRFCWSLGTYTIQHGSGIVVPGQQSFVLPIDGKLLTQGIPGTNNWVVIAAWNASGQPLFGLRQGDPNAGSVGGNPSISPAQASLLWAPENHAHDIGKLGPTITANSTGILLAPTSGDVVTLQAGSSSTVLNFGANSGQRRVCVLGSDLTLAAGFGLGFPSGMLSTWEAKEGDVFIAQGVGNSNWYIIPLKYLPLVEGAGTMRVAAEPGGALNPISSSQGAVDFYLVNDRVTHSTTTWQSVVIPTSKHGKSLSGGIVSYEASVISKRTAANANASNAGYIMRRGVWFVGATGSGSLRSVNIIPQVLGQSVEYEGEYMPQDTSQIWLEMVPAGVTAPNATVDANNLRMFYQLTSSASTEVLRTMKVTGIQ